MALSEIRKLGDPVLLEKAVDVTRDELETLLPFVEKMWRLIKEFRDAYGRGRAIAAPQIGLSKRIICLNTGSPQVLFNPVLTPLSNEMIDVWDDCMSFPNLLVFLRRYKRIRVSFYDMHWEKQVWELEDDMSELLQHENDHLDGILAISKAKDIKCFKWADD
jgi:peptide deformylase